MEKQANKLIKNFLIFFVGGIGSKLLIFLMLPFYTSILTTGQYGEVDLVTTTTNLLLPVVSLGLADAVFRFTMSREYSIDDVVEVGFSIPFLVYAAAVVLLFCINRVIQWPYMEYMSLLLFFQLYYEMEMNYIKATGRTRHYAATGIMQTFIALSLNIFFLKGLHLGVTGYIFAYIISYAIPAFVNFFLLKLWKILLHGRIRLPLVAEMLKYSIPLIFTTISWWIITSSDRYMIRFFMDEKMVGIYSVSTKIPLILQTCVTLFSTVWEISSNEIYENDRHQMVRFYEQGMKYYRAVGYCGGSLLLVCVPVLMKFLAKGEFYQGWKYVPFLLLSVIFSTAGGMSGSIYSAKKENRGAMISVLVGAIVNIALNIIGIHIIGLLGVTISTAVSRMVITVYRMKDTKRLLNFDRQYKEVVLNSGIIIIQAILLITVKELLLRYILQAVCVVSLFWVNYGQVKEIIRLVMARVKYAFLS